VDDQLVFEDGRHRAWSVAIDPQGRLLGAGMDAGLVRVWDVDSGELVFESQPGPGRIRSVTFSETGQCLAWGCGDGAVRTWERTTGRASEPLGDTGGWVRSIAVDPSGRYLGVGAGSGEIQIWDRDTATLSCRLVGHCGRVLSLARLSVFCVGGLVGQLRIGSLKRILSASSAAVELRVFVQAGTALVIAR